MLQKTKVKKIFSKNKVQLPDETLDFLDNEINRLIESWALRCKTENIKRLTVDLVGYMPDKIWVYRKKI
tara:strand:+ start:1321 stop:1527 length:207 start_codon:yes stop_codon:yes gene_type:complete